MLIVKFILGLVPIIWLIIALTGLKMPGYKACGIAIVFAAVVALFYKHLPLVSVGTAFLEGVFSALWPIILVILAALFVYALTLETGAMEEIKAMLSSVSRDKRVLGLIIGWGFGCFMEGMAGFGTAVAIPASILVALNFDPISTVLALLIVNSTPTAFGSVGVPTTSLASATGLAVNALSANTVRIEVLLMALSPFLFVIVIGKGFKALKGMIPFTLIASASFVIPNFIIGSFIGPELPDIIGSICSMILMILVALKMKDKEVPEEYLVGGDGGEQKTLGLRPAAGPVVDLQPGTHGVQGQGHAEELPALVQHGSGLAPVKLGHAAGKTREAEHLRREGETVPADAAELPLGLMAVLLRHQEHMVLFPVFHCPAQFLIDGRGLAGPGLSDDEAQHPGASFSLCPGGRAAGDIFLHCSKSRRRLQGEGRANSE